MSLRIDTSEWIAGALLIGETGLGVLGSLIPSTGDSGPGYAYNDLNLPTDNAKEICGRITTWPTLGTLTGYEDTSFDYVRGADGADSFQYQLYVDGVSTGSPTTVTLQVGVVTHTSTGAIAAAAATVSGTSSRTGGSVTHASSGAIAAGVATVSGTSTRTGASVTHSASGSIDASSAALAATASRTALPVTHASNGAIAGLPAHVSGVATLNPVLGYIAPGPDCYRVVAPLKTRRIVALHRSYTVKK